MLGVPRRVHANKLHTALSALFCRIFAGALPSAARWLTRTRLCWQRKKNGKPKPIKMGELLRSAYAKRLVNQHQVTLRSKVLRMHQWGISLQGACEVSVTGAAPMRPWRPTAPLSPLSWPTWIWSTCLATPSGPASAKPSAHTSWKPQPGLSGNTKPTLSPPFPQEPPSPPTREPSRVTCWALSRVRWCWGKRALRTLGSSSPIPTADKGVWQVFVRPFQFDPFLRALDGALATFGATRGCVAHGNVKSSARPLFPPERQHEFQGWDTPYVHDTVDVLAPEAGTTALGSAFGSREHINARAWESVRACDAMRSAIGSVDHAPTEMVLTRQCADVSKLVYRMRVDGDMLDKDLLVAFDGQLRASVSASLNGDLPDHSWWQATTGVSCGRLGLRTALGIALPAFVAGRTTCRPLVSTMVDHFSHAFDVPNQLIMAEYGARTDAALTRLVATLPPNAAQLLLRQLDEALAERELSCRNVLSGVEEAMQDQPTPSLRHARGITPDEGDEDDEHPLARKRLKIQAITT